jgi:hypothetical protein
VRGHRFAEHDLAGLRAKLWRSHDQLKALQQVIQAWRNTDPYRLTRQDDAEAQGRYILTYSLEAIQPIPAAWSIRIGELLYTVHSALDHLAYQLAAKNAYPHTPERVTFPIYKKRREFWKRGSDGRPTRKGSGGWALQRVPGEIRQMLLEVQPYKRGDQSPRHPLWLLHQLSNYDKHRSLHVIASAVVAESYEVRQLENARLDSFKVAQGTIDRRREIAWLRYSRTNRPGIDPNPQVHVKVGFRVEETFGDDGPAGGCSILETMQAIVMYVADDVFAKRFGPYLGL